MGRESLQRGGGLAHPVAERVHLLWGNHLALLGGPAEAEHARAWEHELRVRDCQVHRVPYICVAQPLCAQHCLQRGGGGSKLLQAQVALTRVFFRPFVRGLGVREDWMVALMVRVPEKLGLPVQCAQSWR